MDGTENAVTVTFSTLHGWNPAGATQRLVGPTHWQLPQHYMSPHCCHEYVLWLTLPLQNSLNHKDVFRTNQISIILHTIVVNTVGCSAALVSCAHVTDAVTPGKQQRHAAVNAVHPHLSIPSVSRYAVINLATHSLATKLHIQPLAHLLTRLRGVTASVLTVDLCHAWQSYHQQHTCFMSGTYSQMNVGASPYSVPRTVLNPSQRLAHPTLTRMQ